MIIAKFQAERGVTILRISGKLIASTLDNLKSSLDSAFAEEHHKAVLNMRDVDIMDSIAAGFLINRYRASMKNKGVVRFCGLQPSVSELLRQSCDGEPFVTYDSEDNAIASIAASPEAAAGD